ncbi:MAG: beta-propeller fold lactonase family protein [Bdellovibrionota bacterium]
MICVATSACGFGVRLAPVPATISRTFVFVGDTSNNLTTFQMDPSTGKLTLNGSLNIGGTANGMVLHPGGSPLIVVNNTGNTVFNYGVNPQTGILGASGSVPAGTGAFGVTLTSDGNTAFVTNNGSSNVDTLFLGGSTLSLGPVTGVVASPGFDFFDPVLSILYVMSTSTGLGSYTWNPATSSLNPLTTATTGSSLTGAALLPGVGVLLTGASDLEFCSFNSAGEPQTFVSLATGLTNPNGVVVSPNGKFAFVAQASLISSHSLAGSPLTATAAGTIATAAGQTSRVWTVDPTGTFLLAGLSVSNGSAIVGVYSIGSGGALTLASTATVPGPSIKGLALGLTKSSK